jgi:hypothetical protein
MRAPKSGVVASSEFKLKLIEPGEFETSSGSSGGIVVITNPQLQNKRTP